MKRMGKRLFALALAAVMAVSLAACGSDKESGQQRQLELPEWIYVPEYVELNDEGASYWSMMQAGDYLYYRRYQYDEETMTSSEDLVKYSLLDGSVETVPMDIGNGSISSFQVAEDGSIYVLLYQWEIDEITGDYNNWQTLVGQDSSGNQLFNIDIKEIMEREEIDYVRTLAVDGDGRMYVVGEDRLMLFDAEGNYKGVAEVGGGSMNSWINGAGRGKDGKVYVCAYANNGNSGGYVLYEIDFDKKAVAATYENYPNSNGDGLVPGVECDFLVNGGTCVYGYDLATQTAEPLFNWLDSDINGQYVNGMGATSDGRILAIINDWGTGEYSAALLTKTPSSEVPQKELILIGTLSSGSELQAAAVSFNKSSSEYRVMIKEYIDYNNWTETTYPDAINNFNNDIVSGNCPDIIALSGLSTERLAASGALADMMPFLEKSTVLKKEDFLENVLEGFTYSDVLVGIPKTFSIQTVVGSAADLGNNMGWKLEDMIAYADAHPDASLFDYTSKANTMYYCMMYNEAQFVDWKTGTCNFNSPEFISLLEFVNRFPEEADYSYEVSTPNRIQSGEVLLDQVYISDFNDVQMYNEIYKGAAVFIGFPTIDGSVGCAMNSNDIYAIAAKSPQKEGAWKFIESYLSATNQDRWSWGFSSNKTRLSESVEEAIKIETYTWTDEDGVEHEEVSSGGGSIMYGDGWSYEYHTPTREEADQILELIAVARPVSSQNSEIMTIISEEAEAFYKGQKSAAEVADVIQRRVKTYVEENS